MTQLEGCIRFWEYKLVDKGLFEPATLAQIEHTVRFLKLGLSMPDFPQDLASKDKESKEVQNGNSGT